jgi:threonyl-tRNA synthetase
MSITLSSDGVRQETVTATDTTGLDLYGEDRTIVAVRVNGELRDLHRPIPDGAEVEPVRIDSSDGLAILRHSAAHVAAQAVQAKHPQAKLGIGPPITDGFYYDFDVAEPFTPEDLRDLEKGMAAIIKERQRFRRRPVSDEEARAELAAEPYKLELIADKGSAGDEDGASAEVGAGELTIYDNLRRDGSTAWKDLCRGPHVPHTGYIPAFALTRSSAAYWRGDQDNASLQRLYGTAVAEQGGPQGPPDPAGGGGQARPPQAGPRARPLLLPGGDRLRTGRLPSQGRDPAKAMEDRSRAAPHRRRVRVRLHPAHHQGGAVRHLRSPRLLRRGHVPADAPRRGAPRRRQPQAAGAGLLPQADELPDALPDLPFAGRSYRELPLRLFEFGSVYRYEMSGVVHGLTRVRGMTQDDAHIYCTEDQMQDEIKSLLRFVLDLLADYGLDDFYLELSTRDPEKSIGSDEDWDRGDGRAATGRR